MYPLVDDALANISASLAKLGRYGMLTIPMQDPEAVRTSGFYNYGPAPFFVGAILDWLFGTSYLVHRSFHVVALLMIGCIGLLVFRRASVPAGLLYLTALIWIFWANHWPMIRPDMGAHLFAAIGIGLLTWAVRTNAPIAWGLGSLAVATAFTSHQITAPLVPATAVVWAIAQTLHRAGRVQSFLACLCGGLIGIGLFLAAIDFRVNDLFRFYAHYIGFLSSTAGAKAGFLSVLEAHWHMAWSNISPDSIRAVVLLFGVSIATLCAAPWIASARRAEFVSYLLPPVVFALSYLAWLGFYSNYASGYVVLVHVTIFWAIAGAIAAIASTRPQHDVLYAGFGAVATAILVLVAVYHPQNPHFVPGRWVDTDAYVNAVVRTIPKGASVWGEAIFGLDPTRVSLVHTTEALYYAQGWPVEHRAEIAPDFPHRRPIACADRLYIGARPQPRLPA